MCNVSILTVLFRCVCSFTEYVRKYSTEEALREIEAMSSSSSESSMSDFSEDEAQDMEL